MAPEIIMRKPQNQSVDVWALGVILYQMFHSKLPHDSTEDSIRLKKIYFHPDLDPLIQDLISGCLHENPKVRPKIQAILKHKVFFN